MTTAEDSGQLEADDARARVEEFREMIRENRIAGSNSLDNAQVRIAARDLLREARTNPQIAREINAIEDRDTRAALINAREESRAERAPITSRAAYISRANSMVRDIEDPARRARAAELVGQMSAALGVTRSQDQVRDRDQERDIEASQ